MAIQDTQIIGHAEDTKAKYEESKKDEANTLLDYGTVVTEKIPELSNDKGIIVGDKEGEYKTLAEGMASLKDGDKLVISKDISEEKIEITKSN